jgi:hypothetical protein
MVAVVMVVVMPATPAPGRIGGITGQAVAKALRMHPKDITGVKPVKQAGLQALRATPRACRKPCRTKI